MNEYDAHIELLTKNPQRILSEWTSGRGLFKFVTSTGPSGTDSCCLSMIRNGMSTYPDEYVTEEVIAEIKADERLPKKPEEITVAHLPVFKEWQERIDKLKNP